MHSIHKEDIDTLFYILQQLNLYSFLDMLSA